MFLVWTSSRHILLERYMAIRKRLLLHQTPINGNISEKEIHGCFFFILHKSKIKIYNMFYK
jgi:hypothetical protein